MNTVRGSLKRLAQAIALVLAFPAAAITLFGRLRPVYTFFAQSFALGAGLPGNYLRSAFYKMTLRRSSIDINLSFGTYFVDPDSSIGEFVSIGSYCIIGRSAIGARTQIGSHVLIPSGRYQHTREADGSLSGCLSGQTVVGEDCWIGDGAIVMAELGEGVTVGAGSVVTRPAAPRTVVAGNPARPLQKTVTAG